MAKSLGDKNENQKSNEKQTDSKALSWGERMNADIAGRRWDPDVRDGMGKWGKG